MGFPRERGRISSADQRRGTPDRGRRDHATRPVRPGRLAMRARNGNLPLETLWQGQVSASCRATDHSRSLIHDSSRAAAGHRLPAACTRGRKRSTPRRSVRGASSRRAIEIDKGLRRILATASRYRFLYAPSDTRFVHASLVRYGPPGKHAACVTQLAGADWTRAAPRATVVPGARRVCSARAAPVVVDHLAHQLSNEWVGRSPKPIGLEASPKGSTSDGDSSVVDHEVFSNRVQAAKTALRN